MTSQAAAQDGDRIVWSARLGAHLEAFRTQAGLRRLDLANRLGVSEETIRLWERGAVQPSETHLVRLIPMLSVEAAYWQHHEVGDAPDHDELGELARCLRSERAKRGLTQAAMAAHLAVAQPTYAGWESGRTQPAADRLAGLASLLGISERQVEAMCGAPFTVDHADWPDFGRLIGSRRQALRLTRADLAERLGVSARAVMNWELGYRRPQPAHITALASVLGASTVELVAALPQRPAPSRLRAMILTRQRGLGLPSTDVARLVGTTEPTISRWVNGHSRPAAENLQRLADVLGLSHARLAAAVGTTPELR